MDRSECGCSGDTFAKAHILFLQDSMSALQGKLGKAAADDRSLLESVYQESIAIATRKGERVIP